MTDWLKHNWIQLIGLLLGVLGTIFFLHFTDHPYGCLASVMCAALVVVSCLVLRFERGDGYRPPRARCPLCGEWIMADDRVQTVNATLYHLNCADRKGTDRG